MDTVDSLENEETGSSKVIHTTVGDLIHAIAEAAEEATIGEQDLNEVTQLVLQGLIRRRKD